MSPAGMAQSLLVDQNMPCSDAIKDDFISKC